MSDDLIVAETEWLRIPKYNGIKLIPVEAITKGTMFMTSPGNWFTVNVNETIGK